MTDILQTDRRTFLRRGAMGAGALWMLSLGDLAVRRAYGEPLVPSPYGPLSPKTDETTGLQLLQLPDGFRYQSFGWTGDVMSDGEITPNLHDGMAAVAWDGPGRLVIVRNHESDRGTPYVTSEKRRHLIVRGDGAGGTTNLIFDMNRERFTKSWASLAGTYRNCAGTVTPWGTWISGEEVDEGFSFEVAKNFGSPTPIIEMGRFSHEAGMVDPKTWHVYQTEDANDCGFYRFIPQIKGKVKRGGSLSMLKVKNQMNANLGGSFPLGTTWDVEWVPIDDPAATMERCYMQGQHLGAATFRRLEGAWWGEETGYFLSTDGGTAREGQVFEYDPRDETLKLMYDSPGQAECENPDNITVTPRGGLLLCEDNAGATTNSAERLLGLTFDGKVFTFAMNNVVLTAPYNSRVLAGDYRQTEWAGAFYSPDGKWLIVNIQTPGITFAITGPWGEGPL